MATRYLYIALHQATGATPTTLSALRQGVHDMLNQPSSCQMYNISCHHPDLTPHVHYASMGETSHAPTTATVTIPSLPTSDLHPDDTTTPLADESSQGDLPGQINQSFHAACKAPPFIPAISVDSDSAAAASTQLTQITAILSAASSSTSVNLDPPRSTPPATSVTDAPQQNSDHCMRSSSMAPGTVTPISHHKDVLPTDLQSCSTCATPPSDQSIV